MDLRVQLDSGEFVNVEMQAFPHKHFTQRILLYWAKNYSSQLKRGEEYKALCPAYSLIFSVYDLFPETKNFYTSFSVRSDKSPYFCFNEDLHLITVELNKFQKREPSALLDLREEWCYLLKESKRMGEREGRELSREEGLQLVEEAKEKARRDQVAREQDSFNSGMEKGRIEGKTEGIEQGIERGRVKLIMSMLEKGMDISLLSKFAGISEEEIHKLEESLS